MAREAAQSEEPLALLMLGSTLLSLADVRRLPPGQKNNDSATAADLIASLSASVDPAAAALAFTLATLSGDQDAVRLIRGRPRSLGKELPGWVANLEPANVTDALLVTEALGDTETITIHVVTAGGYELAISGVVDHNLSGVLKDAFPLNRPWSEIKQIYRRMAGERDVELTDLSPADARARLTEANEHGDRLYPPLGSETWPSAQPLLEWALRHAPPGGDGYSYPEWSEQDREAIKRAFLDSEYAAGFEPDDVSLLDSILWFATDYGPGDPYRWSPTSVEILLLDWLPRKIVAEVDYLDRAPRVLDSFVRFCHAERGHRPALTFRTIDAIDEFTSEYRQIIRTDRPQGPLAVMAAAGWYQHVAKVPPLNPDWRAEHAMRSRQEMAHQVGGHHVLANLDLEPLSLPDDPFEGVADDFRGTVEAIDDLCQRCAHEFFDEEFGVACRLLLADVVRADPLVLRRGHIETAAAAICWILGRANDLLYAQGGVAVKDLLAWFGVTKSVSSRAQPIIRALGVDPWQLSMHLSLGTTRYLTSGRRKAILKRLEEVTDRAKRSGDLW